MEIQRFGDLAACSKRLTRSRAATLKEVMPGQQKHRCKRSVAHFSAHLQKRQPFMPWLLDGLELGKVHPMPEEKCVHSWTVS